MAGVTGYSYQLANNAGIHAFQMRSSRGARLQSTDALPRPTGDLALGGRRRNLEVYASAGASGRRQEFSCPTIREDKVGDDVIHVSYCHKRRRSSTHESLRRGSQ